MSALTRLLDIAAFANGAARSASTEIPVSVESKELKQLKPPELLEEPEAGAEAPQQPD
jgi:hypothetical protein